MPVLPRDFDVMREVTLGCHNGQLADDFTRYYKDETHIRNGCQCLELRHQPTLHSIFCNPGSKCHHIRHGQQQRYNTFTNTQRYVNQLRSCRRRVKIESPQTSSYTETAHSTSRSWVPSSWNKLSEHEIHFPIRKKVHRPLEVMTFALLNSLLDENCEETRCQLYQGCARARRSAKTY